ncbi:MAG: hypothetical protein M1824_000430 [Vezdaea acicularis]|nr:MAG: hypothetical protein M1824_000430 [Vezdaea acicularis]
MSSTPISPLYPGLEMFQRSTSIYGSLLDPKALAPRPMSTATEIYDLDCELSDGDESPRISIESEGRKSDDATTLSSYGDLRTPQNEFSAFDFNIERRPVEGPVGPHLFRASQDGQDYSFHLTMSPITPKETPDIAAAENLLNSANPANPNYGSFREQVTQLDPGEIQMWSPQEVARWMYESGFDRNVVDKFEANDISGAVLVDLKFDDLKELDIKSFGKRRKVWTEICNLRGSPDGSPIESRPSSDSSKDFRRVGDCDSDEERRPELKKKKSSRKVRKNPLTDDRVISPIDSVSIVGIEELIPKPHKCAKGENCAKYRRQQRQRNLIATEWPISPGAGGMIFLAGNPGNTLTAPALRPISEVVPSVVASSDVLGPGQTPEFALEEESLKALQSRDPQENVKQFLDLQHCQGQDIDHLSPQGLEMFPEQHVQPRTLQSLPKLTIPGQTPSSNLLQRSASAAQPSRTFKSPEAFSPCVTAQSPWNGNNNFFSPNRPLVPGTFRRGTPASEMDVPTTAVSPGPVARDASQSVPPDMRYRRGSTTLSRPASRLSGMSPIGPRPSFTISKVDEDDVWEVPQEGATQDSRTPIVSEYNHAGYMKKRKTKMLRHEWQEHHFRLKGTELAMHKDHLTKEELESINVDEFAVACSSIASNKLSAAFKQMKLGSKKKEGDEGAFAFQLIPTAADKRGIQHAATGKTHHFAVKSRDERIDWMRELMLAKALKQKGDGFEISVNGSMI